MNLLSAHGCSTRVPSLVNFGLQTPENEASNLGAHSAKLELCARASIRLACFAGTCQILVRPAFLLTRNPEIPGGKAGYNFTLKSPGFKLLVWFA